MAPATYYRGSTAGSAWFCNSTDSTSYSSVTYGPMMDTTAQTSTSVYVYYNDISSNDSLWYRYPSTTNTWESTTIIHDWYEGPAVAPAPQMTEEQQAEFNRVRAEAEQRAAEAAARQAEEHKKALAQRATAEEVAQKLLADLFGEEMLNRYRADKLLRVDSPQHKGRHYVVRPQGSIDVIENGRIVDSLCIHLQDPEKRLQDGSWLPDADIVLSKAFLLLNDETRFLQVANHYRR